MPRQSSENDQQPHTVPVADRDQGSAGQALPDRYEPIAIVGVGLRFPGGSESLDEFDAFLREGRSGIGPLPQDRWDAEAFTPKDIHDPTEKGKIRTTGGGFLDGVDLFDAGFFNISPKEAQYLDPQQRLLMETAWQALEHAGIDPTPLRRGNGGVYIGASSIDYALEIDSLPYEELDGHLASGITMFPLSGRLSYFLGWRGPSMSVDTACSSSLVALHAAVQGLRGGETDIALCGGINVLHSPRIPVMFSHANMLAPDGQCKTFDEAADGYARAEGCGVLVLKRLSDAVRDGDNVLASIRGTAVGQDGDSVGLTVPNGAAQEIVIRNALAAARLEPGDIQYVEAHGTGTPLGDPIELGGINNVFARSHTKDDPLLVGSAKTNLGHMEPASGLVGVIKAVLQIRSATIYPHLNLTNPSGRIPWDVYPVRIPTACEPWKAPVRRAVVNSFGFAGTIGAVVLEQPPAPVPAPGGPSGGVRMFTVSAKSAAALRGQLENYRRLIDERPDIDLDRLCHSANVTRAHFSHRVAGPVADHADLVKLLDTALAREDLQGPSGIRKIAFMFGGQGSQYLGMGADLYERHEVFRDAVDACEELFAPHLDVSVRDLVLGTATDPDLIHRTRYTQPALFTVEYALARLWMSWGVRPNVLIGHSIGEVVAATVAGLFTLPDAVTLVAARGRLMQSVTTAGGMAAVSAPADQVTPLLADHPDLALAAVNAPDQCVISGATAALEEVVARLREDGTRVDLLDVSHAFHSPLMAEVFDDFRQAVAGITFHQPTLTLVSNVTGKVARLAEIGTPEYWVRHIGEPVLFMEGIRAVAKRGRHVFVEIGPSTALTALGRRCLEADEHLWLSSLRRREPGAGTIWRSLAEFYTAGLTVSWSGVHAGRTLPRLDLPTYAFQRKRYWLPVATKRRGSGPGGPARHVLLGTEIPAAEGRPEGQREFTAEFAREDLGALGRYRAAGETVLPASAHVDLLLALQDAVHGHTRGAIDDLRVHEPLPLPDEGVVRVVTRLRPAAGGRAEAEVVSVHEGRERRHVTAVLADGPGADGAGSALRDALDDAGEAVETTGAEDVYTDLDAVGRETGEGLRRLTRVAVHPGGLVVGELTGRDATAVEHLPGELLESALHAIVALDAEGPVFDFRAAASVRLFKKPRGTRLRVLAKVVTPAEGRRRIADVLLLEGDAPVAELLGVELARPDGEGRDRQFQHRLRWVRQSAPARTPAGSRHVLVLQADPGRLAQLERQAARNDIRMTFVVDPDALAGALEDSSVTDVCWFWSPERTPMSADRLRAECERNYRHLLKAVAVLDGAGLRRPPRLWLVTERAQGLPGDLPGTGEQLGAATLWGFGRVLLTEYPQYRATLLDLPAEGDLFPFASLLDEWRAQTGDEYQVAYRGGRRHVRRLLAGDTTVPHTGGFEFRVPDSGDLADLMPVPAVDRAPEGDEIQVRVDAVTLTPDDARIAREGGPARDGAAAPVLGTSGYGTVVAAGESAAYAPGDRVLVHGDGVLRSTVTVPSDDARPVTDIPAAQEMYGPDEIDEALRAVDEGPASATALVGVAAETADPAWTDNGAKTPPRLTIRPDRTYVVTGGFGGLGLVTAQKLVDLGARHIALLSRRARPTDEAASLLASLGERAEIKVIRVDVGRAEDVRRMTAELLDCPAPVGGIVHAAGEIGKALIAEMDWAAMEEQLTAKVYGGWLLHEAGRHFPELEFFVSYSSIAAVLGGATQGHYAAASAYLDALADWRGRQGLPGLSVNWGAWARVGMSARLEDHLSQEIERSGIRFFSPARALRTLAGLLGRPVTQRVVGEFDWDTYVANTPVTDALYSRLARRDAAATPGGLDLGELLARPTAERRAVIGSVVATEVAAVLHLDGADELEPTAEFVSLGLDSLMAQTVKSALEKTFGLTLPASLTFDHPSVRQLTEHLDGLLVSDPVA
ncbi:SDR family NAD(P)-dependent oxidoreductase [Streptomyces triculaminicus]|uniref:SDR family NAD(P)-dependent oxidoreductase n=1 Tax=Streptomyces triculaminicus TaxID=2816232 RepID=A0A939FT01_9ACTN|nr:type I polyketide synthase [Streptomyces triculaminicus]MBO0656136.1 SDR family NAD(P)-dependent oxidoreductase [Streptomyces triculaminicus]